MARARVKAPATWPRSGDDIADLGEDISGLAEAFEEGAGAADSGIVLRPCDLFTEDEFADIAGTAVTSLDDNGDECWAQGEATIIFAFSAMTSAAWAWFKDPHRFLHQMR